MKRSSHFLGGVVTIIIIAIVIFLAIYFFVPEVSQKFFGISFGEVEDVADAIASYVGLSGDDVNDFSEFFSSSEGKRIMERVIDMSKKSGAAMKDVFSRPEVKKFFEDAEAFAESGRGSIKDYISENIEILEDLL